jgi:hypothetical protein
MVASFKERNMQTTVAGEAPQPVQQRERIAILDVLRGFALFGILTVNMYLFSRPLQELYQGVGAAERPGHDQVADWLVAFFATGKFYTLFSFLFGLGFTIFIARARAKGQRAAPLFARRLLVLLGFGLVHGFFIWVGDILTFYALVGFVLLLFAWVKRPRTLLIWAFAIWLLSVVGMTAGVGLMAVAAAGGTHRDRREPGRAGAAGRRRGRARPRGVRKRQLPGDHRAARPGAAADVGLRPVHGAEHPDDVPARCLLRAARDLPRRGRASAAVPAHADLGPGDRPAGQRDLRHALRQRRREHRRPAGVDGRDAGRHRGPPGAVAGLHERDLQREDHGG